VRWNPGTALQRSRTSAFRDKRHRRAPNIRFRARSGQGTAAGYSTGTARHVDSEAQIPDLLACTRATRGFTAADYEHDTVVEIRLPAIYSS
jgi:hypothetical protein